MRRTHILLLLTLALAGCTGLAQVEPTSYPDPKRDSITFWGHACSYIDVGGVGIVTDPVFQKSLFARHRFIGAPPDQALHATRVVLISHAHDDHLNIASLARFPKNAVVLCPKPSAQYLAGKGITARAMAPGEAFEMDGVRIIAVTAFHPGTRKGIHRGTDGRALGWIVRTPAVTIYYSGDTDYCSTFSDVGRTYAPDIAILNINGHLPPVDAARAADALRAPVVIPSHWGAYGYWIAGGNRHPRGETELRRLLGKRLHVLKVGESLPLEHASRASQENVGPGAH
jgi:L-ascorbate metabolism protein UlaG (beta-lactamase superfamily)